MHKQRIYQPHAVERRTLKVYVDPQLAQALRRRSHSMGISLSASAAQLLSEALQIRAKTSRATRATAESAVSCTNDH